MPGCPFPACCTKPTVICERGVGTYYTPGYFHYEISDAVTAWITETCFDDFEEEIVTVHPLEVDENGNSNGDFATTANCDYCVYAENKCGVAFCCDQCAVDPVCSISATLESAACGSDNMLIEWSYDARGGPPIYEALINGSISVLGDPDADSGTLTTSLASLGIDITYSGSYEFELVVKSVCGAQSAKVAVIIDCMDTKSQMRVTVDLAELDFECQFDLPTTYPEYDAYKFGAFSDYHVEYYYVKSTTSGMTGLNGTYFFERDPGNACLAESHRFIGTVTVDETYTAIVINGPYYGISDWLWDTYTYTGTHAVTYHVYLGRDGLTFERASFTPLAHTGWYRSYHRAQVPGELSPSPLDYHGLVIDNEGPIPGGIGYSEPAPIVAFNVMANCNAPRTIEINWWHRTFPVYNANFGCPPDYSRCDESNCKVPPYQDLIGTVESEWI